nr:potassium channel family protein [Streptomyces sp. HNM0575]
MLLRTVAICVFLVIAYYALPMDRTLTAGTVIGLAVGLLVVAGLLAWQTIEVARSAHPRLRALETVATVFSLFVLLFATSYFLLARNAVETFDQPLTRTDALYFTVTTFATVGYGDIVPATQTAKVIVMVQVLGDLLLIGVALKVVLGAVQVGLRRGGDPARTGGGNGPDSSSGQRPAGPKRKPDSGR